VSQPKSSIGIAVKDRSSRVKRLGTPTPHLLFSVLVSNPGGAFDDELEVMDLRVEDVVQPRGVSPSK
jgi:hypothetical protein